MYVKWYIICVVLSKKHVEDGIFTVTTFDEAVRKVKLFVKKDSFSTDNESPKKRLCKRPFWMTSAGETMY